MLFCSYQLTDTYEQSSMEHSHSLMGARIGLFVITFYNTCIDMYFIVHKCDFKVIKYSLTAYAYVF